MAKGKNSRRKTKPQVNNYRRILNENPIQHGDTTDSGVNPTLVGSDEISIRGEDVGLNQKGKIARVPLKYAIKDYFKKNGIEIIVTLLVVPLLVWMGGSIIALQSDKKLEEYRISQVEARLNSMEGNYVSKDLLSLQVESLKSEIGNISTAEVDKRIELLEKQINILEKEVEKQD